jgi:ADP-glucose pyrophosphorylase
MWYRGTADAVHQNIDLIVSHRPKHVLVLAGDHIYKMDYGPMIAYHVERARTSPSGWWRCRRVTRCTSGC